MKIRNIALAGIILSALAFTAVTGMADDAIGTDIALEDDIKDNEVTIGPGHALYGLMIAWEKLGTTFTFDQTQKLGKQVSHARQRIAEAKAKLKANDIKAAERALENYDEEMEAADETISRISNVDPELIKMQLQLAQQQYILEKLLSENPEIMGLQNAVINNQKLEEKFRPKTARKFVRIEMKDGRKGIREEHDESENGLNRIQIKAEVTSNGSTVNIDLRFQTNSTNETDIADDILEKLQKLRINLSENLKLEHDSIDAQGSPTSTFAASDDEKDSKVYKVKFAIKAQVKGNITDVKVEYKFHLNETTRQDIVDGINMTLSQLDLDQIMNGLDLKVLEHKKVEAGKDIERTSAIGSTKQKEGSMKVENKGEGAEINSDSRNED